MARPTPTAPPTAIIAGDTVKFEFTDGDFPTSEGWALKGALRGENAIEATVSVTNDVHTVTFAAAATIELEPGRYILALWMEGSGAYAGEQHEVYRDVVQVAPSVEAAEEGELQSLAERLVAAGEARLLSRLTDEQLIESYGVAGRTVTKVAIEQLDAMIRKWKWDVWKERHPGQLGPNVRGRFVA